ncbi:MAG: methyltransferase domain-containing protein [Cyanobacteria bacterium P01_A01_bin.114]
MIETTVRKQYDQLAHRYDRRWQSYITQTLTLLKDWTEVTPTDTVLDIACGTGEFERLLCSEHPDQTVVGVDISEKMLQVARQKCPTATFLTASAQALPLADQQFNVIVSANAFHYFEQPPQALAEMRRVLHPDGRLVILDWCRDYWLCQVCDWFLQRLDPAHSQCYTQAELHTLLTDSGFNVTRATQIRFGLIWGVMIAYACPINSAASANAA